MRIAVFDETNTVTNIIVAEEADLESLGITSYLVLSETDRVDVGDVVPPIQNPAS